MDVVEWCTPTNHRFTVAQEFKLCLCRKYSFADMQKVFETAPLKWEPGQLTVVTDSPISPPMYRLDRDAWGLAMAATVALRADCTRRQVGAIVLDADGRTVATGYNGAPAGRPGCLTAGACPRGQLSYADQPEGGSYGNCIAVHAEANALLYAPRHSLTGATIYITHEPCSDCRKLIDGAGVRRIVYPGMVDILR